MEFDISVQGCNQQVIINEVKIIFQIFQIIFSLFHDFSSYANVLKINHIHFFKAWTIVKTSFNMISNWIVQPQGFVKIY